MIAPLAIRDPPRDNGSRHSPPATRHAMAESSFEQLVSRLRRGENDAATQVFERYAARLVALSKTRLNPLLRKKTDPEDVVQSAFKSFFHKVGAGQFELTDWDGLWGLLVVIALRKCNRQARHFGGGKRDVRKETDPPADGGSSDRGIEFIGREPTPHDAAILAETLGELMHDLDDRDQRILQLRLHGHTAIEIGRLVGFTQFTVEGVLKKVRNRWKQRRDRDD